MEAEICESLSGELPGQMETTRAGEEAGGHEARSQGSAGEMAARDTNGGHCSQPAPSHQQEALLVLARVASPTRKTPETCTGCGQALCTHLSGAPGPVRQTAALRMCSQCWIAVCDMLMFQ